MSKITIPFNKPYLAGDELKYIRAAVKSGKISGDGLFTKKCHHFFEKNLGFRKALLTTSCTDALEMAAILLDIEPGDEVIAPAYTFVSTVNAFVLRGAKIVFADSLPDHPNIDPVKIEALISPRTRAVVCVHYAGVACEMDALLRICEKHKIALVEDAAQAIDSFFKGKPLGSLGILSAFSFHETKNIISGEGGLLVVNDEKMAARAEIIREKGTNRSQFFRGEVDKYGWVDIGSSFLPSDVIAAFLFAQLEKMAEIQQKRRQIWEKYFAELAPLAQKGFFEVPKIPDFATNNAHMFYLVCRSLDERTRLIAAFKNAGILAVFHYLSLQSSPYFADKHDGRALPNSDKFTDCLVRLPLFFELSERAQGRVIRVIRDFYK
jgi:dTDP-4-amino-4,6-dideoxygalactose transaminase